ncbi:unnamed protein product [Moneuplotes crassus]|uniref:Uncharacterized protein n=1 Tax=Euplotes crassus TaxID=5936 RepID=A0AAD1Y7F6_EUPCR|nr:unnamed protein product [Moneuplotes crassus]
MEPQKQKYAQIADRKNLLSETPSFKEVERFVDPTQNQLNHLNPTRKALANVVNHYQSPKKSSIQLDHTKTLKQENIVINPFKISDTKSISKKKENRRYLDTSEEDFDLGSRNSSLISDHPDINEAKLSDCKSLYTSDAQPCFPEPSFSTDLGTPLTSQTLGVRPYLSGSALKSHKASSDQDIIGVCKIAKTRNRSFKSKNTVILFLISQGSIQNKSVHILKKGTQITHQNTLQTYLKYSKKKLKKPKIKKLKPEFSKKLSKRDTSREKMLKDKIPRDITPRDITPRNITPRNKLSRNKLSRNRTPRYKTPKTKTPKTKTPRTKTLKSNTSKEKTSKEKILKIKLKERKLQNKTLSLKSTRKTPREIIKLRPKNSAKNSTKKYKILDQKLFKPRGSTPQSLHHTKLSKTLKSQNPSQTSRSASKPQSQPIAPKLLKSALMIPKRCLKPAFKIPKARPKTTQKEYRPSIRTKSEEGNDRERVETEPSVDKNSIMGHSVDVARSKHQIHAPNASKSAYQSYITYNPQKYSKISSHSVKNKQAERKRLKIYRMRAKDLVKYPQEIKVHKMPKTLNSINPNSAHPRTSRTEEPSQASKCATFESPVRKPSPLVPVMTPNFPHKNGQT